MLGGDDFLLVDDLLDGVLLGCFFFGIVFSTLSIVLGFAHVGIDHGHDIGHDNGHRTDGMTPISVGSILAFLTWFGGVGYLARHGLGIWSVASVVIGLAAGVAGGWLVYRLLALVKRSETVLRASDERLSGALARVTSSIRAGGTGEIVYEQRGVRQVSAARSSANTAIPRGTEVLVLKRVNGIAIVEPWVDALESDFAALMPASEIEQRPAAC